MGQPKRKAKRRASATNRGSNSQALGQTNDRTTLTGVSIPRRRFQGEVGKLNSQKPQKALVQNSSDNCDEWENWAADHPDSALGLAA